MQTHPNAEGFGSRLGTVLLLIPVAVLVSGFGFAIRTALAGGNSARIEQDMILGGLFAFIMAVFFGAFYLFSARMKTWRTKWRTVLFTVYLTAAICASLYTVIEPALFLSLVPMATDDMLLNTSRRALLGAVDGCGYGLSVGIFMSILDQRVTRFTRAGILRYSVIYAAFFAGFMIIFWLNNTSELGDRFSSIFMLLLVLVLNGVIQWWDKRQPEAGSAS